jgi:RimJ/RimL family protein N-acetyltransferase
MPPATERPATPAAAAPQSAHLPDRLVAGPLVLRRMQPADAGNIASVVGESLDHLRPWMPWATKDAADRRAQLARITEANELWEAGTDYIYVIFAVSGEGSNRDGALVGTIGLHRRGGEDVAEIGYWIATTHTRRGYATAAARAVTSAAVALPGIRQVQIHCDEANVASAAVPRKLGYRLDRIEAHEPEAPGERGRRMIWVWDRTGDDARGGAG